jgi:uncharacterized lipoprotein YajG
MRIKIKIKNKKKYFKSLILLILAGFSSYSQQITVSGKVTDTLQNPLAYANILAIPENDNEAVTFAISQEKNTNNLKETQNFTVKP